MVSKKSKKKKVIFFFLLFFILIEKKTDMVLGKKRWLFSIGNGAEISAPIEGQKMPWMLGMI